MSTRKPVLLVLTVLAALALTGLWLAVPRRVRAAFAPDPAVNPRPDGVQTPNPVGADDLCNARASCPFVNLVRRLDAAPARGPQSAQADLTMHVNLDEALIAGHAPSPAPLFITVTRSADGLARRFTAYPVPDGGAFLYTIRLRGTWWYWYRPAAGDLVVLRQGGRTLSMTLPEMSAHLLPRREVLSGTAPVSASLAAYLFPFDDPAAVYTATTTATASGEYSLAWAAFPDLRPRDGGYLFLRRGNTSASLRFIAPFLRVQSGGYFLGMQLLPYGRGSLTSLRGEGWDFHADGEGYAGQDFQPLVGRTSLPSFEPGSTIAAETGGDVVTTTIQTVTAQVDQARGLVYGEAPPGAAVRIQVFAGPLRGESGLWADDLLQEYTLTADASGQYSLTLPLAPGNYGLALVDNGDGHESFDWFAAPYFTVHLGWHDDALRTALDGQVDGREPLTVSLYGTGEYPKAQYVLSVRSNGRLPYTAASWEMSSQYEEIALALEGGDRVQVTRRGETVFSATLPALTLEIDPSGEFIYGQAPAGERITLSGDDWGWGSGVVRSAVVTASLTGTYRLPWEALGLGGQDVYLSAAWEAPGGYRVERSFIIREACPSRPADVAVGGSRVEWWMYFPRSSCKKPMTARLRRADGMLKAEHDIWTSDGAVSFRSAAGRPVPIAGGDVLEFETSDAVVQVVVPLLEVHLEAGSRRILGRSEPETQIHVLYADERSYWDAVLTTTASGAFTLTLPANITPRPGARVTASLSRGGTTFTARDVLPHWQINISDLASGIKGVLPPLTPYTLTLRRPFSCTIWVTTFLGHGYADDTGDWMLSSGALVLKTGDVVSLTTPSAVYTLAVPSLSAFFDVRSGRVSGTAPPAGELRVRILGNRTRGGRLVLTEETLPHADGRFSAVFPQVAGKTGVAGELVYLPPSGGEVFLMFFPPHWEVTLGSQRLSGVGPLPGEKALFTWQSAAGDVFSATLWTKSSDGSFTAYLPEAVQPGDLLRLDMVSQSISYTVPLVTAQHDFAAQALTGQAPAGAQINAFFPAPTFGYDFRRVYAGAQSTYGVDTGDLDLSLNQSGYVLVTDREVNTVRLYFDITGYRAWLPLIER